ncbi:MAG: hypothetical protein JSR82_08165 [Verrucomicrobia bacterium]|nr:hypothetical protein [Verrucomicrobiota bacterium]
MRLSIFLPALVGFGLLSLPAAAAEDYLIKLDRPMKVGDRYRVVTKGSQVQVSNVRAGDKVIPEQRQAREVEFEAAVEVLAVSPKGKPQKVRLTETKVSAKADGKPAEVFPDGTAIEAEYTTKKTVYTRDGKPLEDKAGKLLAVVFRLSGDESPDDTMFGTTERKQVGQRWNLNAEAAAAALSSSTGTKFEAKDLQGGCTLEAVVPGAGGPALRIAGDFLINSFQVPLPNGLRMRKGRVTSKIGGLFPVDPAKGVLQQNISTITEIEADGTNNGVPLDVVNRGEESREVRYSYP